MAACSRIENVTFKWMVIETRVISLFLLNVAQRAHFWHHFCILMSLIIKIQDGHHPPIPVFSVLSHITQNTCWTSHEKLVFSNMCLFPGIMSCILTSPNIKIQDGHQRPFENLAPKKIVLKTGKISFFLLIIAHSFSNVFFFQYQNLRSPAVIHNKIWYILRDLYPRNGTMFRNNYRMSTFSRAPLPEIRNNKLRSVKR